MKAILFKSVSMKLFDDSGSYYVLFMGRFCNFCPSRKHFGHHAVDDADANKKPLKASKVNMKLGLQTIKIVTKH